MPSLKSIISAIFIGFREIFVALNGEYIGSLISFLVINWDI